MHALSPPLTPCRPVYSTLYFVPAVFLRMGSFRKE
jgi:hypothetical protein